jgi:hypothetical protein
MIDALAGSQNELSGTAAIERVEIDIPIISEPQVRLCHETDMAGPVGKVRSRG